MQRSHRGHVLDPVIDFPGARDHGGRNRDVESRQLDPAAGGIGQAEEALGQSVQALGAGGHTQDDAVGPQAAGGEGQGVERGPVGPVGVVDGDDERRAELQAVDEAEEGGAGLQRVGPHRWQGVGNGVARQRRVPQELVDDAVTHYDGMAGVPSFTLRVDLPDGGQREWIVNGTNDSSFGGVRGDAITVLAWLTGRGDASALSGEAPKLPAWI